MFDFSIAIWVKPTIVDVVTVVIFVLQCFHYSSLFYSLIYNTIYQYNNNGSVIINSLPQMHIILFAMPTNLVNKVQSPRPAMGNLMKWQTYCCRTAMHTKYYKKKLWNECLKQNSTYLIGQPIYVELVSSWCRIVAWTLCCILGHTSKFHTSFN